MFRLLLDPAADSGGGTTTPTPTPTSSPSADDVAKAVEKVLAKHGGDQNAALRALMADRDTLRDELAQTKGKLPKAGAVVLSDEDAKTWGAYQAIGKPDEITTKLTEGTAAAEELGGMKREKLHGEAAGLHGYKPTVLTKLAGQDNLEIVIQDGKDKAGKPVKVAHVKGEGDKTTPLTEYAEANWKDFLPSLKAEAKPEQSQRGTPPRTGYNPPRPAIGTDGNGQPVRRRNPL